MLTPNPNQQPVSLSVLSWERMVNTCTVSVTKSYHCAMGLQSPKNETKVYQRYQCHLNVLIYIIPFKPENAIKAPFSVS